MRADDCHVPECLRCFLTPIIHFLAGSGCTISSPCPTTCGSETTLGETEYWQFCPGQWIPVTVSQTRQEVSYGTVLTLLMYALRSRRSPDDCKETQIAVVWSCLPFIRSGQNLSRHSERGKKTRQTEEVMGRQHQAMDRPGVRQVPEGNGEQGKIEKTGCEITCGAPTTLAVRG